MTLIGDMYADVERLTLETYISQMPNHKRFGVICRVAPKGLNPNMYLWIINMVYRYWIVRSFTKMHESGFVCMWNK